MDAKKSKKFDVRLIRSKWVMSMNSALKELGAEHQSSSVSSDTEEDSVPTEKISVQLKSNFPTRNNKSFDWQAMKAALLKEAQIALEAVEEKDDEDRRNSEGELSCAAAAKSEQSLCNERNIDKDKVDLCQKMSDDVDISAYGYDIIEALGTKDAQVTAGATGLSPTSSVSSDTSLDSEKLSLRFANLFGKSSISVIDDCNPIVALSKILAIKDFDPLAPQLLLQLVIKDIISLSELSRREDNVINVEIDKQRIRAFAALSEEDKKNCHLSPFLDISNIIVTHPANEFFTFCSCKSCEEYRELVFRIMADHFRAAHMVVMLLDVLIKAYGPMLKNITAYNKFEKLFNSNKKIYWITTGFYYREMAEHMDFIHDEYLSDNMVFVLFSSILMVNNPLLLLKILAFHVECIVKAYAEGFLEIVDPDQNKIPAEEMLTYILNGYDEIMRISEKVATCLFAFENAFLRKFTLTWKLLCQRLYQQHVYLNLTDTMLACIITLKDEELTSRHAALIKRYIHFDDTMNYVDKRWTDVWIELNKFNLTDLERERRKNSMDVFQIFDTVMQDSIAFALQDSAGESDFYNFASLKNRRLVWHRIMTYAKTKWPKGFFEPPNTLVVEDKCKKCNLLLEYHSEGCKCITCSIAGGPLPPRKDADGYCHKCSALNILGEKEVNFYESKILNICTNDDFLSSVKTSNIESKPKNTAFSEVTREVDAIPSEDKTPSDNKIDVCQPSSLTPPFNTYHIAWAVFSHLNNRKRYPYEIVEEAKFCINCKLAQCQLARKILNNEISLDLSRELIRFYQPLSMTREELRSILPNIMFYNRKMIASNNRFDVMDVHDYVVKIYWIYVISIYASYFPCLENIKKIPLNLQCLELCNNDIRVNVESLKGNKDDTKFIEFLDKIKSLSPYDNDIESKINGSCVEAADSAEMDKKLNEILNTNELNENLPPAGTARTSVITPTEIQPSHASNVSDSVDCQPKKMCKEKFKKCCFDHNDLGDHCKENHANKKRLRKDCNHARMNETRDRLRKKLSQIVNDRKNNKCNISTTTLPVESQVQPHGAITSSNVKQPQPQPQPQPQAPATLKLSHPLITNTPITNCDQLKKLETDCNKGNNSLECLNSLCKRLNHLHTKSSKETSKNQQQLTQQPYLETSHKKILLSNFTTQEISASQQHQLMMNGCAKTNPKMISQVSTAQVKSPNNLDFVSEICELIDNYSKEPVNEQKWIKETLSFIEGSANKTGSSKKSQPQTTNPKKAAKKAKQKQRKEEEKRIAELQDLRGQFFNIYFKEFSEKHYLKILKGSKKRDKKKISELEANIKNLQRAKAKVETAILELIATVKQTNTEFKFSYLPTKEQQVEKVKELESQCETKTKTKFLTTDAEREREIKATTSIASINNMNVVPEGYAMPYAHANHFPYNLDYPGTSIPTSSPYDLMRGAPMCYAPPHNQQLTPDVVAAMTANTSCNNNTDPSKRIVTIRRVNLPNVPEPQVTVTAKGSSPDKDKLLYTFINGQLVQTGNTSLPLTPIPTMAVPTVQAVHQNEVSEQLVTVPPPASNLSKTQLKKERRRLAKLVAEAENTAQEQTHRVQDDKRYKGQEGVQFQQQQSQNQQNKSTKKKASIEVLANQCARNDIDCAKGRIRANVNNSASTTSTSTNETNEISNNRTMLKHISTLRRSNSSTTSCSAATTSSSSANSISSQMNTRENSVSSLKPSNTTNMKRIKINENMEKSNEQKPADNSNSIGRMAAKNSRKSKQKKISESKKIQNKPPPTSSESEEAEEEQNKVSLQTVSTAKLSRQRQVLQSKQSADKPQKLNSHQKQNKTKPTVPPPTSSASESDKTRINAALKLSKEVNLRRPKLVDNGQFDNNPFKTLHLHDSDSEMESSARSSSDASEEAQTNRHLLQQKTQINRQLAKSDNKVKQNVEMQKTVVKKVTVEKIQKKREPIVRRPIKESSAEQVVANKSNTQCQKLPNSKVGKNESIHNQLSDDKHLLPDAKVRHLPGQISNRKNKNDNRLLTGETTGCQSKRNGVANNTSNIHSAVINQNKNDNRAAVRNCESKCATHEAQQRTSSTVETKNSSKRSLRSKKSTQKQQKLCLSLHKDCCSGIPDNMGYFNSNEVNAAKSSYPTTNAATGAINTVSPNFDNSEEFGPVNASITVPNGRQRFSTNVSIMDQLNRGVQVENLSLPPGITLTKVDPIKSEQLRQKSESIKKLAKPLQTQSAIPTTTHAFHHPGATIIAPPVTPMSSYYSAPYASVASTAAIDPQSGIIMVEAKSNPTCKLPFKNPSCSAKQSKNKKRRNKSKPNKNGCDGSTQATTDSTTGSNNGQTKIITLRNPMFHGGPVAAAANILNQPGVLPGRSAENYTLPNPLPLDQPAAIIKNDNGMYTIRNPALHHAVTNGLALGGYRQFGNVNYYTPQEAAAEAAKATQKQKRQQQGDIIQPGSASASASGSSTAFSYFSNDSLQNNASGAHNNISISCTSISESITSNSSGSRLSGDAAVIARPTSAQKCISAIGSEIKNAQQQKRKSKEQTWTLPSLLSNDNLNSNASFTMGVGRKSVSQAVADLSLQEKYQQSKYYNGFDVFASRSGGGTHMHHSCGDDSPPPITGYTGSYLDGIPNTGVIRYDDASFLKNLIPGQNLNNEVSIHNVDDTSFGRNANSPSAHRVEITPVYSTRPSSAQLYDSPGRGDLQQTVFRTTTNFRNHLNDFNKDSAMFSSTDLHLNLSEFESAISYEYESATSAGAASRDGEDNHNSILDFNNLLPKKGPNTTHRSSPYLDDFVQNMNNLQISASSDEQISQLNGSNSARSRSNTNVNAASNWW